ncbi:MAG: glycosyltransferase [Lachnospiraceae bacterium]
MIFVTVGTHEQQFNRLVAYVDGMKQRGEIQEDVVIQTGFSTYEPQSCQWAKTFPNQKMNQFIAEARIVITHGGPSSFFAPMMMGKIPVVVPRTKRLHEHVNDHQVRFCRRLKELGENILLAEDEPQLKYILENYDEITHSMSGRFESNNEAFNRKFADIVDELFR